MNTVGIFAGRGDVIIAIGLGFIIGIWVGYKLTQVLTWIKSKLTIFKGNRNGQNQ